MKSGKNSGTWTEISAAVCGASHIKRGQPSQDALRVFRGVSRGEEFLIVALADGHGSSGCPYSDEGAAAAVDTAVEVISAVFEDGGALRTIKANKDIWIPKQLEKVWKAKVTAIHAEKGRDAGAAAHGDPSTPRDHGTPGGAHPTDDFSYTLYGATLLALVAAVGFVFAVQLGDGDILMLQPENNGQSAEQSEEWLITPPEFLGNETDSLCQDDCWQHVKTRLLNNPPEDVMFLLATDGYVNSFSETSGFVKAGRDIYNLLREHGAEYIREHLEDWLSISTTEGSGDDISMGLVYKN